jgi:release factor glutamine methyltransferase
MNDFEVNPAVLIQGKKPKVSGLDYYFTLNLANSAVPLRILDIGTRSGCIAISLAKNIKMQLYFALDVSKIL